MTFVFKNNSLIPIPYTGGYNKHGAEAVLNDLVIPLGKSGDTRCWISGPNIQRHWVC